MVDKVKLKQLAEWLTQLPEDYFRKQFDQTENKQS